MTISKWILIVFFMVNRSELFFIWLYV